MQKRVFIPVSVYSTVCFSLGRVGPSPTSCFGFVFSAGGWGFSPTVKFKQLMGFSP